jgi:hypothetical protein
MVGQACSLTSSGSQVPPEDFWRACTEVSLETFRSLGKVLQGQARAGLEAIEVGARAATARDPAELCARLADYWGRSLEYLRPMTMLPMQGVTFVAALERYLAGGMRTVPEAVYEQRLAACRACAFYSDNQCRKCGCRLAGDVIAKARWASEDCPDGRWPHLS